MSWDLAPRQKRMLEWTRRLIAFRAAHPVLTRRKFFHGRPTRGAGIRDIIWFAPSGAEMSEDDWQDSERRSIALFLAGASADMIDARGRPVVDDTLLIIMNAGHEPVDFRLQAPARPERWALALDSAHPDEPAGRLMSAGRRPYTLGARSLAVFTHRTRPL